MAFRGALVYDSTDQTLTTGTQTALDFDTEAYDSDGIHEGVTNPERLTVPSGVSYVRLRGQIRYESDTDTNLRYAFIQKNGAGNYNGRAIDWRSNINGSVMIIDVETPVIAVSLGDYFTLEGRQNSGGDLDVQMGVDTWFAMEILE